MSGKKRSSGDVELKMLVHTSLVGHLIGKAGRNLKVVEQDSRAKVFIARQVSLQPHIQAGHRTEVARATRFDRDR